MIPKLRVLFIFACTCICSAQNYQTVADINDACSQLGFTSNEDAEIAVAEIMELIGLQKNFTLQECPNINNAVAKMIDTGNGDMARYVLYDSEFFKRIEDKASNDWAATSILAHEIGHHLNGHALNNKGSNHKWELEADEFSGFVLAKMGATLEDAQSAIQTLRYEKATTTHPAKTDRLLAIEIGYTKGLITSKNSGASSRKSSAIENKTEPALTELEAFKRDTIYFEMTDSYGAVEKFFRVPLTEVNGLYKNSIYKMISNDRTKNIDDPSLYYETLTKDPLTRADFGFQHEYGYYEMINVKRLFGLVTLFFDKERKIMQYYYADNEIKVQLSYQMDFDYETQEIVEMSNISCYKYRESWNDMNQVFSTKSYGKPSNIEHFDSGMLKFLTWTYPEDHKKHGAFFNLYFDETGTILKSEYYNQKGKLSKTKEY